MLLIVGSVVFMVGAAVGVPKVFTEPDPQTRLRLLTEHPDAWRAAQPLGGLGALIATAGVGYLAAAAPTRGTRATVAAACLALAVGALAWGGRCSCAAPASPSSRPGRCRVGHWRPTCC
jgi:hypothetical protein